MAEHDDEFRAKDTAGPPPHVPGEGTPPASYEPGEGTPVASHVPGEGAPPASYAREAGPPPAGGPVPPPPGAAPPGRFRRWSNSRPAQFVAVGLLAGLVGGLVGGGVVAAFSDDGHGNVRQVRIERGMPWGNPGFGPRYWGPPGYGQWPPMPGAPAQPAPAPSPTKTG